MVWPCTMRASCIEFTMVGTCKSCKRGLFQMCSNGQVNGVTQWGGCTYMLTDELTRSGIV